MVLEDKKVMGNRRLRRLANQKYPRLRRRQSERFQTLAEKRPGVGGYWTYQPSYFFIFKNICVYSCSYVVSLIRFYISGEEDQGLATQ